ncbi:hypothetical protein VFPPC_15818 [Pochonia chlamydosporia 170]|uniref:Uncharacterized protein n=1 Tax=Pochonia chlamydosporia 170 TaxID=1380566 RepID=A0A179FSL9_METCM|nr:hypothetical protein VFPPC_15818 [Pochonia chlamydosporia 170]OAQ68357.2 hypothetical protein VFPPC_15818 [Pochonia chlamydosporia 170]
MTSTGYSESREQSPTAWSRLVSSHMFFFAVPACVPVRRNFHTLQGVNRETILVRCHHRTLLWLFHRNGNPKKPKPVYPRPRLFHVLIHSRQMGGGN